MMRCAILLSGALAISAMVAPPPAPVCTGMPWYTHCKTNAPGVRMPYVSLGCGSGMTHNVTAATVTWLAQGGHGIDTAYDYENEAQVGAGVRASGVPRASVFVTNKVRRLCAAVPPCRRLLLCRC